MKAKISLNFKFFLIFTSFIFLFHNSFSSVSSMSLTILRSSGLSSDQTVTEVADWEYQGEWWSQLGISVAKAGDVNSDGYDDVIVGVPSFTSYSPYISNCGAVYVFHGSDSGLPSNPNWIAVGDSSSQKFGHCVSSAGDVNADGYDDVIVGAEEANCAYVYFGSGTGLDYEGSRPQGNPANADWTTCMEEAIGFGYSVASAGDVNNDGYDDVIIGAPGTNNDNGDNGGKVFVYYGRDSGLPSTPSWTAIFHAHNDALFGYSVASAGDVNNDDFDDIIIGAPGMNEEEHYPNKYDIGAAFVYLGSASGLNSNGTRAEGDQDNADWFDWGGQEGEKFGFSVSTAGDMNRDDFDDVIIGSPFRDIGTSYSLNKGMVYIYFGSDSDFSIFPNERKSIGPCFTGYGDIKWGHSVACAGDVNHDGYSDVIIGHPFSSYLTGYSEGRALIYYGCPDGVADLPCLDYWRLESDGDNDRFGWSVASAGNVNGDLYDDVIVGAPHDSAIDRDEGKAFVYYGNLGSDVIIPPLTSIRFAEKLRFWERAREDVPRFGPPDLGDPRPMIDYSFSIDNQIKEMPSYIIGMHQSILNLARKSKAVEFYRQNAKYIYKLLEEVPIGLRFTASQKKSLQDSLNRFEGGEEEILSLTDKLIDTLNQIELDWRVPTLPSRKVEVGENMSAKFGGVAWLNIRKVTKAGELTLHVKEGIPIFTKIYNPIWPFSQYSFEFKGDIDKYVNLSFYVGGMNFSSELFLPRILQWDGKSYKDITTNVDEKKKIVTGRANNLNTFVIMNLEVAKKGKQK